MQTVLKQFCYPVNFIACTCSRKCTRNDWSVILEHTNRNRRLFKKSYLQKALMPSNRFKPSSKIVYWPFQGGTSFVDHLCFCVLCFSCFCICSLLAALWSPAWKGLTSWLLLVMFIVFLSLSHVVSLVRCGT